MKSSKKNFHLKELFCNILQFYYKIFFFENVIQRDQYYL